MLEDFQICPYTGLRSFTEDESLYFKGREEHIDQATQQLQRNKFLMLTGASGDGKSSLVYAGIIPNARAGFLKSKYTQWCVADFRPERTPFKNLCAALSRQLDISNPHTVASELQHGFSALVDLYRNSKRYVDEESSSWQQADEGQRAAIKREAGNLIVLVDQFEEFFTNPENYHQGVPSTDANLVLNLLLETARIALEEDLPIYVIFTMRSDYIGQCAAFRALPEYIGFSQFFVPRLNRSQLQQVIEEPATLSGNRITRRLTERLIHDIAEGVDQLPILQHALNQIWLAANNGNEEMDLIHYAMVGGMPVSELPDDQVSRFQQWYESLTPAIQQCYHHPDLQNVLDTHTNKLYEEAALYYQQKIGKPITEVSAKAVIKTAFVCLTKIDQGRAVRNRMTLQEITDIHADPAMGTREVGIILDIFREPGNTFLRPFITDSNSYEPLGKEQVLDITHESLIRNWAYLEDWAKEEFNNQMVSVDFEKQLDRWVESNKSGDFLLSIGPLTFFENWYNRVKPSVHWIARYLPDEESQEKKMSVANGILSNAQEFLARSARKHAVTRAVMRYGPRRIAAVLAILALVVFGSFVGIDYYKRQNSYVLAQINRDIERLSANPDILIRTRGWLIVQQLQLGTTTIPKAVAAVEDSLEQLNLANGIATSLVYTGQGRPQKETLLALRVVDSLLQRYPPLATYGSALSPLLKEVNDFSKTLELAYYYVPSTEIDALRQKNGSRSASWVKLIYEKQPAGFEDIANLNVALEFALNHQKLTVDEITALIARISPFETTPTEWLSTRYAQGRVSAKSFFSNGFRFNGLYQELAYLYAASGQPAKALQAVDTLLKYSSNYFQNDYATMPDNASHVAAYFYKYQQGGGLDEFVTGYARKKGIPPYDFYAFLLGRCKVYEYASTVQNHDPRYGFDLNLVLEFSPDDQVQFFFNKYREALQFVSNQDERTFLTAVSYKDEGIILIKKLEIQGKDSLASKYIPLFDKAMELYFSVSERTLNEPITAIGITYNDPITVPRKFLFLFPDIRTAFHPIELRLFHFFYTSDCFLRYILEGNRFERLYTSAADFEFIDIFFRDYMQVEPNLDYQVCEPIQYTALKSLEQKLRNAGAGQTANLQFLYLYCLRGALEAGDSSSVDTYTSQLTSEKIRSVFLNAFSRNVIFQLIAADVALLETSDRQSGDRIVGFFSNPVNQSSLFAYSAGNIHLNDRPTDNVAALIDSAYAELGRITNRDTGQPCRRSIAAALAYHYGTERLDDAYAVIKNEGAKWLGIQHMCQALAFRGNLYDAMQNIPANMADLDYAIALVQILGGYNKGTGAGPGEEWALYNFNFQGLNPPINYVNDQN